MGQIELTELVLTHIFAENAASLKFLSFLLSCITVILSKFDCGRTQHPKIDVITNIPFQRVMFLTVSRALDPGPHLNLICVLLKRTAFCLYC